ncbi:ABC transporter permease (plasmid) [Streptomyces sp. BI20]|uniref:ABC transporter permease n=1 Tax=Streptomyces sp. BI20 TaxID=3403460 RepID=UPI003C74E6A1
MIARAGRLLRLGASTVRRGEAGCVRLLAVGAATLALCLALVAPVVASAGYAGQAERGAARAPVPTEFAPVGTRPRLLWSAVTDHLPVGRPYPVVLLTPLVPDAPLPPGVAALPGPGQAVLSPALLARPAADGVRERYGTVVGTIADEGLQSPDELLAYAVPARPLTGTGQQAREVVGFGLPGGSGALVAGQSEYDKPLWMFLGMLGCLLAAPALVLLFVAARTGAHGRDRRIALVTALGGTPAQRALIVLGEALAPVAGGALAALGLVLAACHADVRLPFVGHVLVAGDLRARWPAWAAALALAVAVVVLVLLAVHRVGPDAARRPARCRVRPGTDPRGLRRWALLCPVSLLLATRGPGLFFEPGDSGYVLTNWVGVVGALATLPAAVAVGTAAVGGALTRGARRRGRPGVLIAARRMAALPGPIARMTAGLAIAIVLVTQVSAWQGHVGDRARSAQRILARVGTSTLLVTPRTTDPARLAEFHRALPANAARLAVEADLGAGTLTLTGRCPDLRAAALPCAAGRTATVPTDERIRSLAGPDRLYVRATLDASAAQGAPGAVGEAGGTSVLVSRDGAGLPEREIAAAAYRAIPRGAQIDVIGAGWLAGAVVNRLQGDWLTLLGVAGVGVLAFAAMFSGLAEFLRQGRALAPLTAFAGRRRLPAAISALTLGLPLLLGALAGTLVGVWTAFPQTADGRSYVSGATLAGCVTAGVVTAVLGWLWGTATALREAATWSPGREG